MRFVLRDIGDIIIGKRSAVIPAAIIVSEANAIESRKAFCCSDPYETTGVLRYTIDIIIAKSIDSRIVFKEQPRRLRKKCWAAEK
jgi:hypothetical protein